MPMEGGRRRRAAAAASRGQLGGILAAETASPAKGRKRTRDDEDGVPTPRKEREPGTTGVSRRGGATSSKTRKYVL